MGVEFPSCTTEDVRIPVLAPRMPDRSSVKAEIQTEPDAIPKNCRIVVTSILGGLRHEYGLHEIAA